MHVRVAIQRNYGTNTGIHVHILHTGIHSGYMLQVQEYYVV